MRNVEQTAASFECGTRSRQHSAKNAGTSGQKAFDASTVASAPGQQRLGCEDLGEECLHLEPRIAVRISIVGRSLRVVVARGLVRKAVHRAWIPD